MAKTLAEAQTIRWDRESIERAKRHEIRQKNKRIIAKRRSLDYLEIAERKKNGMKAHNLDENGELIDQIPVPRVRERSELVASPEEFRHLVEDYLAYQEAAGRPATFSGMALHLGFNSRKHFEDFGRTNAEYRGAVEYARARIEEMYEERLHGSSPTGAIFALKNYGWSDRQDVFHTSGQTDQPVRIELVSGEIVEGEFTEVSDDEPQAIEHKEPETVPTEVEKPKVKDGWEDF